MTRDQERQIALAALLALPDAADLLGLYGEPRGSNRTYNGHGDPELVKRDLGRAYVEHVRQAGKDDSAILSRTKTWKLKVVRRA